ncbi:ABC transporter permease [Streptosporangium sp. NPDC000396]|uniref:ABC transporter permease n=1 Tax=Streptosporangium sp. NPDC000396 TaxID=3366185 RepID=UPI003687D256
MIDALASEWLKLRSVRSTWHILGAVVAFVLLMAGFTFYVGSLWDGLPAGQRATLRAAQPERLILMPAQICLAVLGVLTMTSEYATGMIRTSLVAVPRRHTVLAAKAAVVAAVALVAGEVSVFVTFFTGRAIIGDRLIRDFAAPMAEELPKLFATGLSVPMLAMVGLGLGAVLRSTAGAITTVVGLLFVVPRFVVFLPSPWNARVGSVLPEDLTLQAAGEVPLAVGLGKAAGVGLSPAAALTVMALYAVAALGTGAVMFTRTDV